MKIKKIAFVNLILGLVLFLIFHYNPEKEVLKYLSKEYNQKFEIVFMYDYSKEKEISVNYDMWVMPKKYSDLVSEGWYDNYYLGNVSIKDRKIVEDNFIKVAVRDSANNFYLPKLKELFGEDVFPILVLVGEVKEKDFVKEMERRNKILKKNPKIEGYDFGGTIYVLGKVKNEADREFYREKIFQFVKYLKETGTFEKTSIKIEIIDKETFEKNLSEDTKNYKIIPESIEIILGVKNINITVPEDMKTMLEKFPKSRFKGLVEMYGEVNLSSKVIISPKKAMEDIDEKIYINPYEKKEDIFFEGEEEKYPDGTLKEYGDEGSYYITEIKNGKRNGISKKYDKNGNVIWAWIYKDNLKEGEFKKYSPEGKVIVKGTYKNDLLDGDYEIYDLEGRVTERGTHKKGKLEGVAKTYYSNGNVRMIANYKNNLMEGEKRGYHPNGRIKYIVNYKNNLREGEEREYGPDGETYYIANYKNDKLHGERKGYTKDGELFKIETWENGKKKSESTILEF